MDEQLSCRDEFCFFFVHRWNLLSRHVFLVFFSFPTEEERTVLLLLATFEAAVLLILTLVCSAWLHAPLDLAYSMHKF